MLSPSALALALLALPSPHHPTEPAPPFVDAAGPTQTVLVIARPEASDLFVPTRMSIRADDVLARNPSLTRATRKEEIPYDVHRAVAIGWTSFRHSNLPLAQSLDGLAAPAVPGEVNLALVGLFILLLAHRHRVPDLGRIGSRCRASHSFLVSNQFPQ